MLASHQSLLHIRQACVQFVVQVDLKILFSIFIWELEFIWDHPQDNFQNATCAVDRKWNGDKNAESPVLAESFRFLWPGCLLARGSRFSEPEIWTIFSRCKSFFCSSKPRFLPSAAQTLSQFRFPVPSCLPTNKICMWTIPTKWSILICKFSGSLFSVIFPPPFFSYFSHLHFSGIFPTSNV